MSDQQNNSDASPAAQFYLSTSLADVNFVFRLDDAAIVQVPAHKILLAMNSNVFEKMFCGELKEMGDVEIVDASVDEFKGFLQFFYLGEINLPVDHIAGIMYLGNKYNVGKCIDYCVDALTKGLTNENVCASLSLAVLYDQAILMEACKRRISLETSAVFASTGFLECSKEALGYILQMDLLSCSEIDVFEACMSWVRAKSNEKKLTEAMVKEHLGNLYYEIRFASMKRDEFYMLEAKYGAILSSDSKSVLQLIARQCNTAGNFNTAPRQVKWNEDKCLLGCRYDFVKACKDEIVHALLDTEEKTIFSLNKPLLLGKFDCKSVLDDIDNYRELQSPLLVEVEITQSRTLDDMNAEILSNFNVHLDSELITVFLPSPILIQPYYFYTICVKGFPANHYIFATRYLVLEYIWCDYVIEFHNDKTVDGKVIGLIKNLYFNDI